MEQYNQVDVSAPIAHAWCMHPAAEPMQWALEEFVPTADLLTERAYFRYVDHGSVPGHAMQDWLASEAQLLQESKLNRR